MSDWGNVLKMVVRGAVEFGIDDAGARIAGAAWPLIKKTAAPVLDELQKRYPALFLLPGPESKNAAAKALSDLNSDPILLRQLEITSQQLESIGIKQDTILKTVMEQNETMRGIGAVIDGVAKSQAAIQESQAKAMETLQSELANLKLTLADLHAQVAPAPAEIGQPLSLGDIFRRANQYQSEAMRYLDAGDYATAALRVRDGKALALAGFRREPNDADMLATLGYLEKTNAQISWETGAGDPAEQLGAASRYFAKALEADPENVSAMNGLADAYIFAKDYDRAIELGAWVLTKEPRYGAAAWDLAIALEGKIAEVGPDPKYLGKLLSTYEWLKELIPSQPLQFGPDQLAHVEERLQQLHGEPAAP